MRYFSRSVRWAWLAAGLLVGGLLSSFWTSTPLHAVATDRAENITIATGVVEPEVEAFLFLDSQTGTLRAAVPSIRQRGGFQATWQCNLNADLATVVGRVNAAIKAQNAARRGGAALPEIQVPDRPKYMMVTGLLDIPQGPSQLTPGRSLVYVTEATTGVVLAYALPWSRNAHRANKGISQPMILWAADQLAIAVTPREE
jgi:hypothetical protein